jgi:hypothetical protein
VQPQIEYNVCSKNLKGEGQKKRDKQKIEKKEKYTIIITVVAFLSAYGK